ncbi:MAG: hypothetical protein JWO33_1322 [Caulobacteraceae bacterium]|nr:hypothetical protein [Caulobacteraceae bacterium]
MALVGVGDNYAINMDNLDLGSLTQGVKVTSTSTLYAVTLDDETTLFGGVGFTYNALGIPNGGIVNHIQDQAQGVVVYDIVDFAVPAVSFVQWANAGDTFAAKLAVLSGADTVIGGPGSDLLRAYAGDDVMVGGFGDDSLDGGTGSDTINGSAGNDAILVTGGLATYLRGDEGDDAIKGGSGFDDINGNMGNDTASGGSGEDWVVGGRDNDMLFGEDAYDLVYGNLGDDTLDGGAGNDIVRGGQDNDVLTGGSGDDFVSGDKGFDTMTGGTGADVFHTFGDAGVDRVTDFSIAQGDRVQVDPGTVYSVAQVGNDTVISMTGGGVMTLVGVSMGSLTGNWIFGA